MTPTNEIKWYKKRCTLFRYDPPILHIYYLLLIDDLIISTITIPALGDGVDDLGDAVVRAECDGDQQQVAAQFFEIFFNYQIFFVTKNIIPEEEEEVPDTQSGKKVVKHIVHGSAVERLIDWNDLPRCSITPTSDREPGDWECCRDIPACRQSM